MKSAVKIIRAFTVPDSICFVEGMMPELLREYGVTVVTSPGEGWRMLEPFGDVVDRKSVV